MFWGLKGILTLVHVYSKGLTGLLHALHDFELTASACRQHAMPAPTGRVWLLACHSDSHDRPPVFMGQT